MNSEFTALLKFIYLNHKYYCGQGTVGYANQ